MSYSSQQWSDEKGWPQQQDTDQEYQQNQHRDDDGMTMTVPLPWPPNRDLPHTGAYLQHCEDGSVDEATHAYSDQATGVDRFLGYPEGSMPHVAPSDPRVSSPSIVVYYSPTGDRVETYQHREVYQNESYDPQAFEAQGMAGIAPTRNIEQGPSSDAIGSPDGDAQTALYSQSPSDAGAQVSMHGTPQDAAEYSVACPYRCGTVLTGVHAVGNLTRHLKSQACPMSGRAKMEYPCPVEGCIKRYTRSDGLKVHLRRRHGMPPAQRKSGLPMDGEDVDD